MNGPFGGVETGGTWVVCAIGSGPDDLLAVEQFETGEPDETLPRIAAFFAGAGGAGDPLGVGGAGRPAVQAIGIGSFGPARVDRSAADWGRVLRTPKPGWSDTDVAGPIASATGVPVAFETDVTAAAIGEARWGAGRGVDSLCYLTVGTGIGGGLLIDGRPVHGLLHPEVGHLRVPHDPTADRFPGVCPLHGDCWEGLAGGPAIAARWGCDPRELPDDHPAWALEAEYLALGILAIVMTASPGRVVAGGGVLEHPGLRERTAARLAELNAGYLTTPLLGRAVDEYLVAPELGDRAGVLGALALAADLAADRSAG
jgi:fructokinase